MSKIATKDIIEILKDDANYYGDIGRQYLSNSDIGTLLKNPKMFRVPQEDNKNFAEGRYFHQLLLEPDKAMQTLCADVSSRNSKAYKEFIADNNVQVALLSKECENILQIVKTIRGNIDFFDMITHEGSSYEQPAVDTIKGMLWKGKADIITPTNVIDLKTTSNIQDFRWSARKYNYDSQCYIYQQLFGKPLIFLVVDKITHQLGMYQPSEDFVRGGEEKVERAIEVYNTFFGDNPTDELDNYYINQTL